MKKKQRRNKIFDSPLPYWLAVSPLSFASSGIYAATVNARNFAYDAFSSLTYKPDRPTISIGGIRAGGTGKTPVAQLIGQYVIQNCGYDAVFLSRGYGRRIKNTVVVRPGEKANWMETGDEPCMIHTNIPQSWLGISADRAAAAKILSPLIPEKSVFILDDGFQHRRVGRDLNIVCLSESVFCDRILPAGYLREPVRSLRRADVLLIVGAENRIDKLREVKAAVERYLGNKSTPICAILLQYPDVWVEARTGEIRCEPPFKTPVALSGIARPERFLAMLRSLSVEPAEVRCFRDHYKFNKNDIASIHNIYLNGVVTTEKDAVRLLSREFAFLRSIWYLKIGLRFADAKSEARVLSAVSGVAP